MAIHLLSSPDSPLASIQQLLSDTARAYLTSPYVKESFIKRILPQLNSISDVKLIVRLTSFEVSSRSVDMSALDLVSQVGEVRCSKMLHAKSILVDSQAYVGSFNFTHSAFFRNLELGVIWDDCSTLHDLERYFCCAWEQSVPFDQARQELQVDQAVLQTVGWQKVREWWDIIADVSIQRYNPSAEMIVLLPMPRPPIDRPDVMIRPVLEFCARKEEIEVVLFSELYGPIPLRFVEQFGESGEYFFDEPAENFYTGSDLTKDGHKAAQVLATFIRHNLHSRFVSPLPDNYKRLRFLKVAEKHAGISLVLPHVNTSFIGYIRGANGARAFLRDLLQ